MDKKIEDEKVMTILEAGRWAPSAANRQPWHFIVVREQAMRKKLADAHQYGRFMAESPVVIVVLGDPEKNQRYHLADPHNAVQNMLLAAFEEGLSTCWMGVRDTGIEPEFRTILGIPSNLRVICSISVGYSDHERNSSRIPLEDVVSWENYGERK